MIEASLVLVVLIVGLLMYYSSKPKLIELGRIMFAAAVFAICFSTAGKLFVLLSR